MSYPLRTAAAVTALGLAGAAVWTLSSGSSDTSADRPPVSLGRIATIALTTQHNCTDLLSYYRTEGARLVGPYGLNGGPQIYAASERAVDSAVPAPAAKGLAPAADSAASAGSAGSGAPDSTTNVQVAGVDESDVVKTNGDLMVAVINGEIRITRLAGAKTKTLATWRPAQGYAQSVLLDGTTAVIIGDRNGGIPLGAMKIAPGGMVGDLAAGTDLTILDLADPAHPRPVRRLELAGNRSGEARLVDGELRLALTAGATGIKWKQPVYPNTSDRDPVKAQAKFKQVEDKAEAANKRLIAKSTIANWIPQATVVPLNAAGKPNGPVVHRPLVSCEQVAIPGSFSGLSTLALVSTDLHADAPLTTWRAAGVIADGSTLYATADHVWLATSRWDVRPVDVATSQISRFAPSAASTQIHRFDTPLREQPKYIASGEIAGSLLNQFAMDEKDGLLRVASTTDGVASGVPVTEDAGSGDSSVSSSDAPSSGTTSSGTTSSGSASSGTSSGSSGTTGSGTTGTTGTTGSGTSANSGTDIATPATGLSATAVDPAEPKLAPKVPTKVNESEGRVTVLKVDDDQLVQVGVVTGLGVGERIRGVRFVDDVGYVVTYRQTDPLYTIDLSDPAHPRVRGELAVLGYSAYLHPAGDGRLLGLGQDGTKGGQSTGLQLSLFDVGNLDSPRRLDRERLAGAWSDAENDHHAFTMAGDLVLIPYSSWTSLVPKDYPGPAGYPDNRFDAGVIAIRVGQDSLGTPTTLRPLATGPITFNGMGRIPRSVQRTTEATPMRTVVHDGSIYTLTSIGVAAHSATDFSRQTFATF